MSAADRDLGGPRPFVSSVAPFAVPYEPPKPPPPIEGVRADKLSQPQKRQLWAHIQANEPEQLAFLQDETVKGVLERLEGVVVFDEALLRRAGVR